MLRILNNTLEKIHFSPLNFKSFTEAQRNIWSWKFEASTLFRISPAFWWTHSFLLKISFWGWKKPTKWTHKNFYLKNNLFLMCHFYWRFVPLKLDFEQKWMGPSESWWNSEQGISLTLSWSDLSLCLCKLSEILRWKVKVFNVFFKILNILVPLLCYLLSFVFNNTKIQARNSKMSQS